MKKVTKNAEILEKVSNVDIPAMMRNSKKCILRPPIERKKVLSNNIKLMFITVIFQIGQGASITHMNHCCRFARIVSARSRTSPGACTPSKLSA